MRKVCHGIMMAMVISLSPMAIAQSAVGVWKSVDDETQQAKALIHISAAPNGELSGKVIKLLQRPDALCEQCQGELKGKPVDGMTIVWGLKQDQPNRWSGGHILDPKNGKVYRAKLTLSDDGQSLDVRGFLGVSLFGRSQVWYRQ